MLIAGAMACKNNQQDKDSVSIAKEVNKDKADTGSNIPMNKDTVAATMGVQKAESDFAVEAANGSMIEIQLGALAKTKAVNQRVRDFAAMISNDHMKINQELQKIATAKNITLPQALSDEARKDIDRLNRKDRTDFDRVYMRMMVADHRRDIDAFEKAAKECKDPALKSFITETLPILKKHRDSAAAIDRLFMVGSQEPTPAYP
jgi:putative membrane protein